MADGVWKGVKPKVIKRSDQLLQNKFFDPSTLSMRKGSNGWRENGRENNGENSGPLTSLPVDRLTATDCNAAAHAKMNTTPKMKICNIVGGIRHCILPERTAAESSP